MKHLFILLSTVALIVLLALVLNWHFAIWDKIMVALTPRPENFTELYFEDHLDLQRTASPGATLKFAYTIHNLEHQQMNYPVNISVSDDDAVATISSSILISEEMYTLEPDETKTVPVLLTLPTLSTERAKVSVKLTNLNQSIHFWVVQAPFTLPVSEEAAAEDVDAETGADLLPDEQFEIDFPLIAPSLPSPSASASSNVQIAN